MAERYTRRDWMRTAGAGSVLLQAGREAEAAPGVAKPLEGAFIILSTPYMESKAVDYDDLAREVEFLNKAGVQGLVWPQLSSELLQLNKEERLRGMDTLARANKSGRAALILGVQGGDTRGDARICGACRIAGTGCGDRDSADPREID